MRAWRKHHVTNHSCVPRWLEVLYLNDLYYLDVEMLRQEGGGAMSVGWSIWSPQNTVKWVFPMVVPQKSAGFPTKSNHFGLWRVPNHGNTPKSIPKILGLWPLLDGLAALRPGLGSQWLLTMPQLCDTATARSSTRSGCGFWEVMLVRAPEANTADGFTHCWWWSLRFSHRPQRFALLSCWGEVLGKVKGCPCANSDILVRYNFQYCVGLTSNSFKCHGESYHI